MFFLTVSHAILGCVSLEDPNHDGSSVTRVIVQQKNLWFLVLATFALRQRNLRTNGFTLETHQRFSVRTMEEETQHSRVILDLCSRKTRTRKSYDDYCDYILFDKLCFENVFRLTWTISLSVEIKLHFQICMLRVIRISTKKHTVAGEFGFAISCYI